jgi:hypothetical protein
MAQVTDAIEALRSARWLERHKVLNASLLSTLLGMLVLREKGVQ